MGASQAGPSLHHTAIAVHDLDRSIAFYRDTFGGEVEAIIEDIDDVEVAQLHALESARFTLAFVRFGPTRLELFQFALPQDGREIEARAHLTRLPTGMRPEPCWRSALTRTEIAWRFCSRHLRATDLTARSRSIG
jgi:catechol 2,3-dioxygenase-like lactoylglutathione lyase family enzyme